MEMVDLLSSRLQYFTKQRKKDVLCFYFILCIYSTLFYSFLVFVFLVASVSFWGSFDVYCFSQNNFSNQCTSVNSVGNLVFWDF
jgi:hypothetical protein